MSEIDELIDEMMPKIKEKEPSFERRLYEALKGTTPRVVAGGEKDPKFFTPAQFKKRKRKKKIARQSRRKNKRR